MKEDWSEHATREEVQRLREQVHYLKNHPHLMHTEAPVDSLLDSMERLQAALDKLVTLFEQANKEIYTEYEKGLHEHGEQLKRIEEQNEKIARGIVAIADMLKQQKTQNVQQPAPSPAPMATIAIPQVPVVPKPAFPPHDVQPFTAQPVQAITPPTAPLPPLNIPPAPQFDNKNNGRRSVLDKFSFQ